MGLDVGKIIAYEQGSLDARGTIELFAELVASGAAWTLQGCYGRMAEALIGASYIDRSGAILEDLDALEAGR